MRLVHHENILSSKSVFNINYRKTIKKYISNKETCRVYSSIRWYFTISSKPALSVKKNKETEQALAPQMQGKQQRNREII